MILFNNSFSATLDLNPIYPLPLDNYNPKVKLELLHLTLPKYFILHTISPQIPHENPFSKVSIDIKLSKRLNISLKISSINIQNKVLKYKIKIDLNRFVLINS